MAQSRAAMGVHLRLADHHNQNSVPGAAVRVAQDQTLSTWEWHIAQYDAPSPPRSPKKRGLLWKADPAEAWATAGSWPRLKGAYRPRLTGSLTLSTLVAPGLNRPVRLALYAPAPARVGESCSATHGLRAVEATTNLRRLAFLNRSAPPSWPRARRSGLSCRLARRFGARMQVPETSREGPEWVDSGPSNLGPAASLDHLVGTGEER
jgi:hypothetical protein